MGCFKLNTPSPRRQRESLLRICFERLPIIQLARPDDELEISTLCPPLLEKPIDGRPVAPVFRRRLSKVRRNFAKFEHELAEVGGTDSRERSTDELEWQGGHVKERHAEGQPAEDPVPPITEIQKLSVPCWR